MKTHKWADIKAGLEPETQAAIEAGSRELAEELHLAQLRKAKEFTQEAMAELLGVAGQKSPKRNAAPSYTSELCGSSRRWKANLCSAARFKDGVEVHPARRRRPGRVTPPSLPDVLAVP